MQSTEEVSKPQCAAGIFPDDRVRKERVWPCLLSSHRMSVLLIGVEGFPHGGFRHFIRYINIRGVRPEERGEEKKREFVGREYGFRERSQCGSFHRVREIRMQHTKQPKHACR